MKRFVSIAIILTALSLNGLALQTPALSEPVRSVAVAEKFLRTELYFGRNMSNGTVNDAEWQTFVDEFVTPRFPEGLTILDADGQWKGKDGSIAREQSKVLVLLYPRKLRRSMHAKIEEIRAEYKKRFAQESVMRIDITKSVEVTF
jgi:hypothetical protein